jgi:hypothetical protein
MQACPMWAPTSRATAAAARSSCWGQLLLQPPVQQCPLRRLQTRPTQAPPAHCGEGWGPHNSTTASCCCCGHDQLQVAVDCQGPRHDYCSLLPYQTGTTCLQQQQQQQQQQQWQQSVHNSRWFRSATRARPDVQGAVNTTEPAVQCCSPGGQELMAEWVSALS